MNNLILLVSLICGISAAAESEGKTCTKNADCEEGETKCMHTHDSKSADPKKATKITCMNDETVCDSTKGTETYKCEFSDKWPTEN